MNAAIPWRSVLRAMWQRQSNGGVRWVGYLVGALFAAAVGGMLLLRSTHAPLEVVRVLGTVLLVALAFGGWIWFVDGVLLQNEPHAARIVPGHARALRRVLMTAALGVAAVAGLVGAWSGHGPVALAATVAGLLAIAWVVRIPALGVLGWVLPATSAHWPHTPFVGAFGAALGQAWRDDPWWVASSVATLLGAASWASLRTLVQEGDARHQRNFRVLSKRRAALSVGRQQAPGNWMQFGPVGSALRSASTLLYRQRLAQASATRGGPVLGRALVGLGPGFHWSGQLGSALVYGAIMAAILTFVWHAGPGLPRAMNSEVWPLSFGVLAFALSTGTGALATLYHTRREQSLLMLLPGMPRGDALNRQLARHLMAQFVGTFALAAVACIGLLPAGSAGTRWVLTMLAACLPVSALLWRDWSRLRMPSQATALTGVFIAALIGLVAIGLQAAFGIGAEPCALAFGLVTLGLWVWRWRALRGLPSALPAARRS